jgi:hypothetical protein
VARRQACQSEDCLGRVRLRRPRHRVRQRAGGKSTLADQYDQWEAALTTECGIKPWEQREKLTYWQWRRLVTYLKKTRQE